MLTVQVVVPVSAQVLVLVVKPVKLYPGLIATAQLLLPPRATGLGEHVTEPPAEALPVTEAHAGLKFGVRTLPVAASGNFSPLKFVPS